MAEKTFNTTFLRTVALILVSVGAVGSLYFMFNASRNQNSILLITLFTVWILSPFVGLFLADKFSNRWTVTVRASLYWLMIILTIVSLVAYSGALNTPKTKNAFVFLIIPLISWLLMTMVILTARRLSRKMHDNPLK
jgi:hypothetical protein